MNDHGRAAFALAPAIAEAAPNGPVAIPAQRRTGVWPAFKDAVTGRLGVAALIGVLGLALATAIPAATALISTTASSGGASASYGPPMAMRAAASVSGNWERSNAVALPPADQIGAAVIAGAEERHRWAALASLMEWAERDAAEKAAEAARAQGAVAGAYSQPGTATTLNRASGYAPGTVLPARITIYGCVGPGGGFCNNMASGAQVFEGAAACSSNLPFGTKITISGDPTGRVYECLDRGHLPATWIDVFFYSTTEGMAWQSNLGTTQTQITIVN
jgi:hypothetical protein